MMEGVQILDFDFRYIYVNDALAGHGRNAKEELLGHTMMEKYPGIEQTEIFKAIQRCMNERTSDHLENEFIFTDKSKAWFELSIQSVPEGVFILTLDITKRKEDEKRILKSNRLYSFISAINQSIVHITDEMELLNNTCKIAIEIGGFKTSWIGLLDKNGKLNMVCMYGDELMVKELQKYSGLDFSAPKLKETATSRVLRTGNHVIINDIQNNEDMKSYREIFILTGMKSTVTFPIKKAGKIVGVFGFYSSMQNFFDEDEIILLNEAA